MSLLAAIGSQQIPRMIQFRAKPATSLLRAIEEAAESEKINTDVEKTMERINENRGLDGCLSGRASEL